MNVLNVFVSMRFKGRNEEEIKKVLNKIRHQLKNIYVDYTISMVCNYWYEAPSNGNKKLHELGNAISQMADCDLLVYVARDGSEEKPLGCAMECFLWQKYVDKPLGIYFEDDDLVVIPS